MDEVMSTFCGQVWFIKRLYSVTSKNMLDQTFWNRNLFTFILRRQDMRQVDVLGDAYRYFFLRLPNYFEDYCVIYYPFYYFVFLCSFEHLKQNCILYGQYNELVCNAYSQTGKPYYVISFINFTCKQQNDPDLLVPTSSFFFPSFLYVDKAVT